MERGNGCNHLSAFASASFIIGPDVVFVVGAAVVFAQPLPKKNNRLRQEIFDRSGGKWIRVLHTNKTIMRFA